MLARRGQQASKSLNLHRLSRTFRQSLRLRLIRLGGSGEEQTSTLRLLRRNVQPESGACVREQTCHFIVKGWSASNHPLEITLEFRPIPFIISVTKNARRLSASLFRHGSHISAARAPCGSCNCSNYRRKKSNKIVIMCEKASAEPIESCTI